MDPNSVRGRLERALAGEPVDRPVYAVYDWFVKNRPVDWPSLFAKGLGQIVHVELVGVERPHLEIVEQQEDAGGRTRRTTRWITDRHLAAGGRHDGRGGGCPRSSKPWRKPARKKTE